MRSREAMDERQQAAAHTGEELLLGEGTVGSSSAGVFPEALGQGPTNALTWLHLYNISQRRCLHFLHCCSSPHPTGPPMLWGWRRQRQF